MLQRIIGVQKSDWHFLLFATLWVHQTLVMTLTRFPPFHLVYVLEVILPIECEIPLLKLTIERLLATYAEEERLLHLSRLDETWCDFMLANEAHKRRIKVKYDKSVKPRIFSEGYLVLLYEKEADKLGRGKF